MLMQTHPVMKYEPYKLSKRDRAQSLRLPLNELKLAFESGQLKIMSAKNLFKD